MIVRDRPSGWRLFFVLRGCVAPKIGPQILAVMLIAAVLSYFHGIVLNRNLAFTAVPFTIIGLALSIFMGFRNSAAYDRYWEGRRLWGELLITGRILARQVNSLVGPEPARVEDNLAPLRRRMIYKTIAFVHALRHHLRDTSAKDDLAAFLGEDDLRGILASVNPPEAVLRSLGEDLRYCLARKLIADPLGVSLDATLNALDHVLGSCERIKSTPIPFSYTLLLRRTAYLYCFLLPFGLVATVGIVAPIVAGLVSYTFFGLDALNDEIEEPFGMSPNDLPLDAISRSIEINLREALGETDLPEPLLPKDYCLS